MEGLLLCHADARAESNHEAAPIVTLAPLHDDIAKGSR